MKHGRKASPEAGGPGGKKKRCVATKAAVGGSEVQCICHKKDVTPSPMNRKGVPRTCRVCSMPAPPGEDLEGDGGGVGDGDRGVGVPFPDGATLKRAVLSCLDAEPTGANCRHDGIPISDWDVSRVTDMNGLFAGTAEFNADISNWGTAAVTRMDMMFAGALVFKGDISNWNTAAVTRMDGMFFGARAFNQDISSWNTAAVTLMDYMFDGASAFNQDLSSWDVMAVTNNEVMWTGSAMTDEAHKPCTATGVGADGKTPWRKC